ncbi:MAG: hypothetical protein ACRELB_11520 [Polyangiaceae bacterium]
MMNTDPIARRVVHRYRREVQGTTRVEYSTAGDIDAIAVVKLLKPKLGNLFKLRFMPALQGSRKTVAWEAVTERDEIVRGRVVLHAVVTDHVITSWGEVVVDTFDRATWIAL